MSKSLSIIGRGISALALCVSGLALFTGVAGAATLSAPTVGTATDATGSGTIKFTWTNPSSTASITGYQVVDGASFATGTVLCSVSGAGIAGVANTCSYTGTAVTAADTIKVYSVDGTAADAVASGAFTIAAPTAPTFTSATAGNGTIVFAFTEPTGDLVNTKAVITTSTGQVVCTTTSKTTCTANSAAAGLDVANGATYTFTLTVYNAVGSTSASAHPTATSGNAPGAFTASTSVNYASGKVTVSWTASTPGTGTNTYAVTSPSHSSAYTCETGSVAGSSCVILLSGLQGGLPFNNYFTVTATNSAAQTATTKTSVIYVGATPSAPVTPTDAAAISGGTLTATWNNPASVTGILGYNVQLETCASASVAASTCTASGSPVFTPGTVVTASGHNTYAGFTGLTQGNSYSYTVTAVVATGTSTALQGAVVTYAISVPGSATISAANQTAAQASATGTSFTAYWTAPTSTGGSPIVGYSLILITCTTSSSCVASGHEGTAITSAATSTATSYTFTGLAGGYYEYEVKAITTNAAVAGTGVSAAYATSSAEIAVLNGGAGVQLAAPTITYSTGSVKFSVASLVGASAFKIVDVATGNTAICTLTVVSGTGTCTVAASAVTAGHTYAAYSVDANGTSSILGLSSAAIAVPGLPTITSVYTGTNGYLITWATSGSVGVNGITVIATDQTTGVAVTATKAATASGTYLLPASLLVSGDTYKIQISAFNSIGSSAYTASATVDGAVAVGSSSLSGTVTLTSGSTGSGPYNGTLTVAWTGNAAASHDSVASYTVTATSIATASGSYAGGTVVTAVVTASPYTFTGLINGISYSVTVAVNGVLNTYPASTAVVSGGLPVQPAAPTGVSVTSNAAGTTATVKWTAPTNTGGAPLAGINVAATVATVAVTAGTCYTSTAAALLAAGTCTFTGLTPGNVLKVSVTSANLAGLSAAATALGNDVGYGLTSSGTPVISGAVATDVAAFTAYVIANDASLSAHIAAWATGLASGGVSSGSAKANAAADLQVALAGGTTCAAGTGCAAILAADLASFGAYEIAGLSSVATTIALFAAANWSTVSGGAYYALASSAGYVASTPATASFTMPSAPGAPTAVTATVANGNSVTVSWTAPASNGGSAITGYVVKASAGTISSCTDSEGNISTISSQTISGVLSTSVTCTISTVSTGTTFKVYANNATGTDSPGTPSAANGNSGWSALSNSVVITTKPNVPTSVVVANNAPLTSANNGGIVVSWAAPASDSTHSAVVSYSVVVDGGTSTEYSTTTTNNYVVLPAISNTSYHSIVVSAVNAAGSSAAGAKLNVAGQGLVSTVAAPTATVWTQDGLGTVATTSIVLQFTNNDTTGLPVTYTVVGTGNGATVYNSTTAVGVTSLALPYVAGETFTVYANTAAGISSGVTPTPYANASVPTDPTATPSSISSTQEDFSVVAGSATVSTSNGVTTTVAVSGQTAQTSGYSFTGLTANTTYTYTVTSCNQVGCDATPLTGSFTTPPTTSGAPTAVTSAAVTNQTTGEQYVTVTWTAPANTGGLPLTGYTVNWGTSSTGGSACTSVLTAASTTCTIDVGTSASGNNYATVTPYTAAGAGTAANSQGTSAYGATTYDANPGAAGSSVTAPVIGSVVSAGAYSLTVTWSETNTSGIAVTGFSVVATGGDATTATCTGAATATSCTLTGLSNQGYSVVVTATAATTTYNSASSANTSWTGWTAPSQPAVILGGASAVGGTASILWNAPVVTAGAANSLPTTYSAQAYTAAGANAGNAVACTASPCTVTGLANATAYTVVLTPSNAVGTGTATSTSAAITTLSSANPSAPTITGAIRNATGLAITWTAPASLGSAAQLVGYWVTVTDPLTTQQYTCPYNSTYGVVLAPAVSCSISGLSVGSTYNVSITAIGVDGALNKLLSAAATKTGVLYNVLAPEPVMATFLAVTAKQKSVSALSPAAKTALSGLISSTNDGAQITIAGYGTTKAIALARANAAANYLFRNGAAVHVTIKSVISKTVKTALVTVTVN